ncbi:hypothetical protein DH2020_044222 [Rehmannia glutinosa]|uniref:Clp R domain-containing protein n=1 Tax=Rehmannia glutinosa TaxID=99300 RepID=A0ABR0UHG7_REHGL
MPNRGGGGRLDDAVTVSRRRGHAQTTSLHMVSSLLSFPNSSLREACTRTRNNAYSARVQLRALELSLRVSLDRLPSSKATKVENPPISNSLMAAIKRSQANQRRQPENFSFYQQQQYSSACSVPIVKVELQNLILSILDDPLVSRVFGEAGFRSCDVKMATFRLSNIFHSPHLYGYYSSKYKRPAAPLFLCHSSKSDKKIEFVGENENSRRIGEVMVRNKKRNPFLLGVSASDALKTFLEILEKKFEGVLPVGLSGLSVICVEDEILRFVNGDCDEGLLKLKFEEVEKMLGNDRVVVNLGDLKGLAKDGIGIDGLRYLVGKFAKLLEDYGGKVWLIGAAASYDDYFHILNKFPSIEGKWDLEILPITSLEFSMGAPIPDLAVRYTTFVFVALPYLMESFVPLGGFFSMPSDTKSSLSSACQYLARCHICNEKYNQEVTALSNGGLCSPSAEPYQPFWLQSNKQSSFDAIKAKDNSLLLNVRIAGLQKKWDSFCQNHHYNRFPCVLGFQVAKDKKEITSIHSNTSSTDNKNVISSLSCNLQQSSMMSKTKYPSILSQSGQTSPNSVISVSTDLGLGIISSSTSKEPEKPVDESHEDLIQKLSGSFSTNVHAIKSGISNELNSHAL